VGTYKRGRIWWISYADPDGATRRESTGQTDARAAERIYRQRKRDVAAGTWVDPRTTGGAAHPTVADYAERWVERQNDRGLRNARCEEQKLRGHVLPLVGGRRLEDLRPKDVVRFVDELRRRKREDGKGTLAPRTVRQCYDVLRRLCRDAVIEEVIAATPCVLPPGTLPAKRDRDPSWRATAVFSRSEVEALLSDERVPWDRRTFYALELLLGVRHGEAAGRRWRDYDSAAEPLGRIWVATQYDDQPLKAGTPREVPVHPTLAAILAEWRLGGFPLFFGRPPRPDDFIVPETDRVQHERLGLHRLQGSSLRRLGYDLAALGLRPRRQHDARRTLISLGRADGCAPDVLRACTHGSSREVFDDYTTWPWDVKCREVAKLRVQRRPVAEVHNLLHSDSADPQKAHENHG
jgi:integrase